MAVSDIKRITLETIDGQQEFSLSRKKAAPDEAICLYTEHGRVVLRRSAVIKSGSSWQKLRAKLYEDAPAKGIPFEDLRIHK